MAGQITGEKVGYPPKSGRRAGLGDFCQLCIMVLVFLCCGVQGSKSFCPCLRVLMKSGVMMNAESRN